MPSNKVAGCVEDSFVKHSHYHKFSLRGCFTKFYYTELPVLSKQLLIKSLWIRNMTLAILHTKSLFSWAEIQEMCIWLVVGECYICGIIILKSHEHASTMFQLEETSDVLF